MTLAFELERFGTETVRARGHGCCDNSDLLLTLLLWSHKNRLRHQLVSASDNVPAPVVTAADDAVASKVIAGSSSDSRALSHYLNLNSSGLCRGPVQGGSELRVPSTLRSAL